MAKKFLLFILLISACTSSMSDAAPPLIDGDLTELMLAIEDFPDFGDQFFIASITDMDMDPDLLDAPTDIVETLRESGRVDGARAVYEYRERTTFPAPLIMIFMERFDSIAGAESYYAGELIGTLSLVGYPIEEIILESSQPAQVIDFSDASGNNMEFPMLGIRFQYSNILVVVFVSGDLEKLDQDFASAFAEEILRKINTASK